MREVATTKIILNKEQKELFLKTIYETCDVITSTLGADGKTVVISERIDKDNVVTKDGYTVSKSIRYSDAIQNAANMFIQQLTKKQVDDCGDATTTTTLLFKSILKNAMKAIENGGKPSEVKRGVEATVNRICDRLKEISQPIDDEMSQLEFVATTSANNDAELGKLIATAYKKAGRSATFDIRSSETIETSVDVVGGMLVERGWLVSPAGNSNSFVLEGDDSSPVFVLVYDHDIKTMNDLMSDATGDTNRGILPQIAIKYGSGGLNGVKLVIYAPFFEAAVLGSINENNNKGASKILLLMPPSQYKRDISKDIAAVVGAKLISDEFGLTPLHASTEHLGKCNKIVVGQRETIIFGGGGDASVYFTRLKEEISTETNPEYKVVLERRLARATSGFGTIKVGGATDVEVRERIDRVDDAVRAAKCALDEGIVAGGGVTLLKISEEMNSLIVDETDGELAGELAVIDACCAPIEKMCESSDLDADDIINKVVVNPNASYGYNFREKSFCDLLKEGVIDSTKVMRCSLMNAASVACQIISSDYFVIQK